MAVILQEGDFDTIGVSFERLLDDVCVWEMCAQCTYKRFVPERAAMEKLKTYAEYKDAIDEHLYEEKKARLMSPSVAKHQSSRRATARRGTSTCWTPRAAARTSSRKSPSI